MVARETILLGNHYVQYVSLALCLTPKHTIAEQICGKHWKGKKEKTKILMSIKMSRQLILILIKLKKLRKWVDFKIFGAKWIGWDLFFNSKWAELNKSLEFSCNDVKPKAQLNQQQAQVFSFPSFSLPLHFFLLVVFQLRNIKTF